MKRLEFPTLIIVPDMLALLACPRSEARADGSDQACLGDCNYDANVTVDELIRGVNLALGAARPRICLAFYAEGDEVTIDKLLRAVNAALDGCTEPPPAQVELTVDAKYAGSDVVPTCPPACVEKEDPDGMVPLYVRVCSRATGCFDLQTGESAMVSRDAVIYAPDGVTPGEQLPALNPDIALGFSEWGDGTVANPRRLPQAAVKRGVIDVFTIQLVLQVLSDILTFRDASSTSAMAGCATNYLSLFFNNQLWVPVEHGLSFRDVQGPVIDSFPSPETYPFNHNSNDWVSWVLLAGEEPSKLLSRRRADPTQYGEPGRLNQIEVLWEEGSYPAWARPKHEVPSRVFEGETIVPENSDLMWARGQWAFDCASGADTALEQAWTELHPPVATAAMKGTRQGKIFLRKDIAQFFPEMHSDAVGLHGVQVEFWANGDAGGAGLFHVQDLYEFTVPLPPRPSPLNPRAQFLVKADFRLLPRQPQPVVQRQGDTLLFTVDLRNYHDEWNTCKTNGLTNCRSDAYAATIVAGWEIFELPKDFHEIQLTVPSITIYDDSEGEDGGGEFYLRLEVDGELGGVPGTDESSAVVKLEQVNPLLVGANPDAGPISFPLLRDRTPLQFDLHVRADSSATESNFVAFQLSGYEDDDIWDDGLPTLARAFRENACMETDALCPGTTAFGAPDWANCFGNVPRSQCDYGEESFFGTVRGQTPKPIPYEDHAWPPKRTYSLTYSIHEIRPEP